MTNINLISLSWRFVSLSTLSCLILGCFVLMLGCNEKLAETYKAVPRVKVFTVGKVASGQSRRISGRVQASDKSALSFGVGGQVVEIIAKKGQVVAKGQLLAMLDQEPLQIALKEARARLSSLRAKQIEAETSFDRTSSLFKQKANSQKDLDTATAALGSIRGQVKGAQSSIRKAELDLERGKLIAPFPGQVVDVLIDPFQDLTPSQAAVLLQAEGALEIEVRVPETLIRNVEYGQIVQASFPTAPDSKTSGIVISIGAEAEAGNAFPVTVRLSAEGGDLRPGMTASVTFNFSDYLEGKVAYLIPLSAINVGAALLQEGKPTLDEETSRDTASVFVFNPTAKQVELRQVAVGELRGNEVEVFKGLNPGEQIVSAGVAFMRDGMKAEIWEQ